MKIEGKTVRVAIGDGATPENFNILADALTDNLTISNPEERTDTKDSGGQRQLFTTGVITETSHSGTLIFSDETGPTRLLQVAYANDKRINIKIILGNGQEIFGPFQITNLGLASQSRGFAEMSVNFENADDVTLQAES